MNRFFSLIQKLIILALVLSVVSISAVLYYMEFELPDIEALNTVQLQVPLEIYTRDNKLIATFGEKRRIPVPYDEIPAPLIEAVLATEDQRYFQHSGVDLPGLGRAAIQLLATGRKTQGGSTITMQVARSFYLSRNKTFARKLREILLAIKIEHKLSKEKILELYLNKVFLGNRSYGVGAAAAVYYGKKLNELTIDQMAMIAGLPKAPSQLNPLANPAAALKRRDHVLTRMHDEGYIDDDTYNKAINTPLNASYHDTPTELKAPYVAELVRSQLEQMYGDSIYTDGFQVYTTIDSRLQGIANDALRDNLLAYDRRHGYRGPEKNLGIPSIDNMDDWELTLKKMPTINNLQPAAVVEMTKKTITVLLADGKLIIIPWEGMSWARKQINADYLGPMPGSTKQIANLGDIVRIIKTPNGYMLSQLPKAEAGLVALNPNNGAILALVGGFDYLTSKFNRVTNANRQPGSSFKPFVYSAALDKGFTLATVINDAPIVIENVYNNSLWRPQNSNHKYYGLTRLRTAITKSRNLVTIRLLALIGMPYTVNYLKKFGFVPSQLPPGLSLALGTALVTPLQMAQAYAVFANGGMRVVPYAISTIYNSHEQMIYQAKPLIACTKNCEPDAALAPRVLSEQTSFLISSALHDVIEHGTAIAARSLNRNDIAGKTGTTQNQVDAWFAGYSRNLVAISWMGFDLPQSLHEYGNQAALPIWSSFMSQALKNVPDRGIEQPPGIVSMRISPYSGVAVSAAEPDAIFEFFNPPYLPEKSLRNTAVLRSKNIEEQQAAGLQGDDGDEEDDASLHAEVQTNDVPQAAAENTMQATTENNQQAAFETPAAQSAAATEADPQAQSTTPDTEKSTFDDDSGF
ncbi:MAG TPA: penicillin-binding protein 1A [Gammaproteobacteria bacterium]|jgi:penicillin-binding protein 1A|nr:penicillin-binding protein 1A [Gammaproteobacteria bacterium]